MMNKKQVVQVIAEDGGTGALGLNPFDIMPTLFGEHSSHLHREYSKKNSLSFYEFKNSSLSYDIDQFEEINAEGLVREGQIDESEDPDEEEVASLSEQFGGPMMRTYIEWLKN